MTDHNEKDQALSDKKTGFGELLQEERLLQGLSLELISQKTGINLDTLIALENSDRRILPADVFNRGFIKIYAKLLQIDPKESLDSYENQWGFTNGIDGANIYLTGRDLAKRTSILEDKQALAFIGIVLVVAVVFLAFQLFTPPRSTDKSQNQSSLFSTSSNTARPEKFAPTVSLQPVSKPTPAKAANGQRVPPPEQEVIDHTTLYSTHEDKEESPEIPAPERDRLPEPLPVPPLGQPMKSIATTETIPTDYTLVAEFSERTWLKITIDHNNPAEYTFQANEKHTWQANETLKLLIGNAGGVQLLLNGSEIKLNSDSGQVITLSLP